MMLENVAEWFDWVDASADDIELSGKLEALNKIVKRLAVSNETRRGWLWRTDKNRNRRKMADNWSKVYSFLVKVLERSKNPHLTELESRQLIWYVERSLYLGRQAIWCLSDKCAMIVMPEKWSLEEQLEEDEKIA